jgi:hypothetical protein
MGRKKGTKNDKGTSLVITFPRWERDTSVSSDDSYEEDFVCEEHPDDGIHYGKWSKYQRQDVVPVNAFADVYDMEIEPMIDHSESDIMTPEDEGQEDSIPNPMVVKWYIAEKAVPKYKHGKGQPMC